VLGDADAVREFVLAAAQRVGLNIARDKRGDVFRVAVGADATATLPAAVAFALPANQTGHWIVTFTSPSPAEGAEYVGRNHRFVASLARFLMEEAMTRGAEAAAARCGVIRTRAVERMATILLLRVRYLLQQPEKAPLLSEEVVVTGFSHGARSGACDWFADDEALRLLGEARPDANIPLAEKRHLVGEALAAWPAVEAAMHKRISARAAELEKSHKRVRQAVALRVRQLAVAPQFPPDLLGILVLQPMV
jgi:hypothetical protein